jgi:hypothetical protein
MLQNSEIILIIILISTAGDSVHIVVFSAILKIEILSSYKTLVNTYQAIRGQHPEDHIMYLHLCENLESHTYT